MGRKTKYSKELKLEIVKRYLKGESAVTLAKEYDFNSKSGDKLIHLWVQRYRMMREKAFDSSITNKSYSYDFKIKVINEYLLGNISYEDITAKYNISASSIVKNWVKRYNQGIEIKDYDPKSEVYTMKTRRTTFEERLDIVKYVLANNNDYKGAADMFSVPYASVYQWVSKYNKFGEDGLSDRRGRPTTAKPAKVLTVEEKQSIEIEKLKRELERQKMINEVLKKNIEIQERIERDSRILDKKTNTKR